MDPDMLALHQAITERNAKILYRGPMWRATMTRARWASDEGLRRRAASRAQSSLPTASCCRRATESPHLGGIRLGTDGSNLPSSIVGSRALRRRKTPRTLGCGTTTRSRIAPSIRWPTHGTSAPIFRANPAYSCRMSAASPHTRRNVTRSRPEATKAFDWVFVFGSSGLRQIDACSRIQSRFLDGLRGQSQNGIHLGILKRTILYPPACN